jgi:heat shock protein HslJ
MTNRIIAFPAAGLLAILILVACSSASSGEEKTIFVGPATVSCEGEGPQRCLLIAEDLNQDFQLWYDDIEGFEHEQGFLYELIVEEQTVEDPPAGASSINLVFKEEVNRQPVAVTTVFIGPSQVECQGEGPQLCYLYKENPDDDWLLFYDEIEGFEYEEGYDYELTVAKTPIENPPADGSSIRTVLMEVVDKTPAARTLEGTIWTAVELDGQPLLADINVTMGIDEGRVGGFASCNTYSGPAEAFGDAVIIGPLSATRAFCPQPIMAQETRYLQALQGAAFYQVDGPRLELFDKDGNMTLVFEEVEPSPLVGTQWELVTYNTGSQGMTTVLDGSRITALFEDGQVGGSAGCNSYFAAYEVNGDNISISDAGSTKKLCPELEGVMDQEAQYLSLLGQSASFQIVADQLEIVGQANELLLVYQVSEPVSLENLPWQITGYNNGRQAVTSVIIDTEITAEFVDGTVSGLSGCNNYSGSYELDGDKISVGPLAVTEKFCAEPEGIVEQETEYLAALQAATTYRIDGERMEMRDDDGALQIQGVIAGAEG